MEVDISIDLVRIVEQGYEARRGAEVQISLRVSRKGSHRLDLGESRE